MRVEEKENERKNRGENERERERKERGGEGKIPVVNPRNAFLISGSLLMASSISPAHVLLAV